MNIQPGAENATENCQAKLDLLLPILDSLDAPASAVSFSSSNVDLLNSPRESSANGANSPRYNPYIIIKAIEREV